MLDSPSQNGMGGLRTRVHRVRPHSEVLIFILPYLDRYLLTLLELIRPSLSAAQLLLDSGPADGPPYLTDFTPRNVSCDPLDGPLDLRRPTW